MLSCQVIAGHIPSSLYVVIVCDYITLLANHELHSGPHDLSHPNLGGLVGRTNEGAVLVPKNGLGDLASSAVPDLGVDANVHVG
jgi:hypothetical protein